MAKTDRAAFKRALRDAEDQMTALFGQLATDIGQMVMRAQGPDGTVPVELLQQIQREAGRMVEAVFLSAASRRPFDDQNEPLAPYPGIIADGQRTMIELALSRQAKILDRHLPEDLQRRISSLRLKRATDSPVSMGVSTKK